MTRDQARGSTVRPFDHAARAAALACLVFCVPAAGSAQVLEIGDNGAVTVHDRPEVTLSTGASPIVHPTRHSSRTAKTAGAPTRTVDLTDAADQAQLSPDLVEAVAWRESHLHAGVVSTAGAIGEMQLMPGTAQQMGVDPYDSRQNFRGGALYLGGLVKRYDGDMVRALAAYNAGPGAVDRYGGVPPYKETQAYVSAILDRLSQRADAEAQR